MQQVCSIPFRSTLFPGYFHSFGMTDNYIVFVEQPFKLDIVKLATAYFRGVSWGSCLKYDKDDIVSSSHDPSLFSDLSPELRCDAIFFSRLCFTSSIEKQGSS